MIQLGPRVVPYIGTWIETQIKEILEGRYKVVPYIGTWIETRITYQSTPGCWSYLI